MQDHRGESGALGSLGNRVIVKISWLVALCSVLTEENLLLLDGRNGFKDSDLTLSAMVCAAMTHLLVTDVLGRE